MGSDMRDVPRIRLVFYALFALLTALAVARLVDPDSTTPQPSISEVRTNPADWLDHEVQLTGTLLETPGTVRYVLDDDGNRIGITGVSEEALRDLTGSDVEARGRVDYQRDRGITLNVESFSA
ncbi:MAG TPA: hypothetical protein VNL92_05535 [Dehalococcoidia bacterium]|nr:hypothetical protein [Dehalococcoidia bacterium]